MQDISKTDESIVKKRPRYLFMFLIIAGIVAFLNMFTLCDASKDYTKHTYVAEGIALASKVKIASVEFYEKEKRFPNNNQESGLLEPDKITGQSVKSIEILPKGKIKITYNNKLVDNAFIILEAILDDKDKIIWQCSEVDLLEMKVIPANCRGQIDEFNTQNNIDHP